MAIKTSVLKGADLNLNIGLEVKNPPMSKSGKNLLLASETKALEIPGYTGVKIQYNVYGNKA